MAPVDQYWPDEVQGPVYYGKMIVQTKSESVLSDYVTRVMEIQLVGYCSLKNLAVLQRLEVQIKGSTN